MKLRRIGSVLSTIAAVLLGGAAVYVASMSTRISGIRGASTYEVKEERRGVTISLLTDFRATQRANGERRAETGQDGTYLLEEKKAFLVARGWDLDDDLITLYTPPPKVRNFLSANGPGKSQLQRLLLSFYTERLADADSGVAEDAFQLLSEAYNDTVEEYVKRLASGQCPPLWTGDGRTGRDADIISLRRALFWLCIEFKPRLATRPSTPREILAVADALAPKLEDPSSAAKAERIMNTLTFYIYEDQETIWWSERLFLLSRLPGN